MPTGLVSNAGVPGVVSDSTAATQSGLTSEEMARASRRSALLKEAQQIREILAAKERELAELDAQMAVGYGHVEGGLPNRRESETAETNPGIA